MATRQLRMALPAVEVTIRNVPRSPAYAAMWAELLSGLTQKDSRSRLTTVENGCPEPAMQSQARQIVPRRAPARKTRRAHDQK